MICPDVNLLLYATIEDYPEHPAAKQWWKGVLSSKERVCLAYIVVIGFIRISTHPSVFTSPLSLPRSIEIVDGWLAQPNTIFLSPAEGHWDHLKSMLLAGKTGGNLTTDAHIAALAADYGLVIHSNDADFARFPNAKCVNPLAV